MEAVSRGDYNLLLQRFTAQENVRPRDPFTKLSRSFFAIASKGDSGNHGDAYAEAEHCLSALP